jgi:hypothetical protein
MKRKFSCFAMAVALVTAAGVAWAGGQEPRPGTVIVPPSNIERPQDIGKRSHTNFLIFIPAARSSKQPSPASSSGPGGETPGSLSCVYQTWAGQVSGCPVTNGSGYNSPSGGTNVIAIVDAYDYPTAASDFQTFSQQFGLPYGNECGPNDNEPCFTQVYATGSQPKANCSWAQEESLDIEWSHAMAPHAQIVLVEAASNSNSNLMQAVQVASNEVMCGPVTSSSPITSCSSGTGTGEVSMSWGSSEFSSESSYDGYFTGPGVTYFASSGDSGGKVIWPSASPNVVSAGGTTVNRNSSGDFTGESTWSSAGGGPSNDESMPSYQNITSDINTTGMRGTPDISFDANPASGVSVFDSTSCQGLVDWMVFGGTSVAAPSLSGISNESGAFDGGWDNGGNSSSVQSNLYSNYGTDTDFSTNPATCSYTSSTPFYDITQGSAGTYPATACWDFASGIGTDRGLTAFGSGSTSPSFSLSASPTTLSLTDNSSGTSTISVTPSGGFTGTVGLTTSAPSGLTASLSSASLSYSGGSYNTSTLTVTASSTAPAGIYTVTVTGSSGSLSSTTNITVTVLGVSSLTLSPSTVTGGTSATGTVTLSAAAPSGGASVALSSNNSAAQVPSSVTVESGYTSATFTVTTSTVSSSTSATISASLDGSSQSATITVSTASTGSFSVSASPGNVVLKGGGTASYTVTVAPSGGYTGTVDLSMTASPTGPTGVFSPASITGGSGSSTLTVTVSAKGNYTLTITGTDSVNSSLTSSTTVGLKVH